MADTQKNNVWKAGFLDSFETVYFLESCISRNWQLETVVLLGPTLKQGSTLLTQRW